MGGLGVVHSRTHSCTRINRERKRQREKKRERGERKRERERGRSFTCYAPLGFSLHAFYISADFDS